MKTISIDLHNQEQTFQNLSELMSGNLKNEFGSCIFNFNNEFGQGVVKSISLPCGMTFLSYDVQFYDDIIIQESIQNDNFHFSYSTKGELTFHDTSLQQENLKEFRPRIHLKKNNSKSEFKLSKHVDYSFITITIANVNTVKTDYCVYDELSKYFKKHTIENEFLYLGSFNMKIAETLEAHDFNAETGIVGNFLFQAMVQNIIALGIKNHKDDDSRIDNQLGSLNMRDLKVIKDIAKSIKHNPEIQYTISKISYESGLSPAKLQEGFKLLYNVTVNEFIRNARLNMAEKLIENNELTISEIVYSVGLNSRSYFSRIFKNRYHCSPKVYKERYSNYSATA